MEFNRANKNQLSKLNSYIVLGVRFGIGGALIGLILNIVWGNFQEIQYTIYNGFIIGFLIGFFDFLFSIPAIKKLPYSVLLLLRTTLYFVIILISIYGILIIFLKANGLGSESLSNPQEFEKISQEYFLVNVNTLYILTIAMVLSFLRQLKSFFGKRVLFNYLIGIYHKPSIEERIFMFLDLNDATTLAEKLGPQKYSTLLRDFFNDIDEAFTHNKGQIFQYVGDEVVVIWNPKQGLKNNNCINSYFMALDIIEEKKEYYLNTYQSIPSFKAAIHIGEVSITEIGVSKKEIVYHGDTMNTTARICASAHKLGRKFLITKTLFDRLSINDNGIFNELGEHSFKGKDKKIVIYAIGSTGT